MSRAYYNEIDPYAAQWIRNLIAAGHVSPGDVDERDIRDVRPGDLRGYIRCHFFAGIAVWDRALDLAGWPPGRPVWTGSCPCPPFSAAGKGQQCPECGSPRNLCHPRKTGHFVCLDCGCDRHADDRHLYPEFARLIRECRPPRVFGEQVASADGRLWLAAVRADLEAMGYGVGAADLCAAGVGAPHIRQRLWFVADAAEPGRRDPEDAGADRGRANPLQGRGEGLARLRQPQRSSAVGLVADADGGNAISERVQRGGQHGQQPEDRFSGVVGDAERTRLAVGPVEDQQRGTVRVEGAALGEAGALCGPWRGAQWLWCSDHRWRPTEPGTFPLAYGAPARVGRLRAYGNAIVPQAAAAFIAAALDTLPSPTPGPRAGAMEG